MLQTPGTCHSRENPWHMPFESTHPCKGHTLEYLLQSGQPDGKVIEARFCSKPHAIVSLGQWAHYVARSCGLCRSPEGLTTAIFMR
jgi:hypothetical protein